MAGGLGSRLGAITKQKPKPAIIINGKPFICYKIDWLLDKGFKKFSFILSYKEEILKKIISQHLSRKEIEYEFFSDSQRSGTFNAIYEIQDRLSNKFFYTNADEVSNYDIIAMYNKFVLGNAVVTSLLAPVKDGKLKIRGDTILTRVKDNSGSHIELGCKFIDKSIFQFVEKSYYKFEDFIYVDLIKEVHINFFLSNALPLRIDTPNDIKNLNNFLKKNE